jgi:hypothetical protein
MHMADSHDIVAGRLNYAETTTRLEGHVVRDGLGRFTGDMILRVGPFGMPDSPVDTLDAIHGVGWKGGDGLAGFGSEGSDQNLAGAGVIACGGALDTASLILAGQTDRESFGPGIVASAGAARGANLPPNKETRNVGVFGQGGDEIVQTIAVLGGTATIGPEFAGAGVVGRGGIAKTDGGVPGAAIVVSGGFTRDNRREVRCSLMVL